MWAGAGSCGCSPLPCGKAPLDSRWPDTATASADGPTLASEGPGPHWTGCSEPRVGPAGVGQDQWIGRAREGTGRVVSLPVGLVTELAEPVPVTGLVWLRPLSVGLVTELVGLVPASGLAGLVTAGLKSDRDRRGTGRNIGSRCRARADRIGCVCAGIGRARDGGIDSRIRGRIGRDGGVDSRTRDRHGIRRARGGGIDSRIRGRIGRDGRVESRIRDRRGTGRNIGSRCRARTNRIGCACARAGIGRL